MKITMRSLFALSVAVVALTWTSHPYAEASALKTHRIFSENMVLQRDKPITIWGWTEPGQKVSVEFGKAKAETTANDDDGRWEVTFPAREADVTGRKLLVVSGDEMIEMKNIVIGDVWVMNGQSNMAWGLRGTEQYDLESAQAAWLKHDLPGDAIVKLHQLDTPGHLGLPRSVDAEQSQRIISQGLQISRRLAGRDTSADRLVLGMRAVEWTTTAVGIAAGGGVLVAAALAL